MPDPLKNPGAGIDNNKPMSDPGPNDTDEIPGGMEDTHADEKVSPDSSEDILSYIKELHQKAIDAINGHVQKANVNRSGSTGSNGQQLYSVDNILMNLESIESPTERAAFYKEHRKLVGTALQIKNNSR